MNDKDTDDRNHPCYVGIDDMGNIVGAVVHEKDKPERSAVWVAAWIMDGLTVKLTTVGDVRVNFGRKFEGPYNAAAAPYHVRVLVKGKKGKIHVECEGDEQLLEDYNENGEGSRRSNYSDEDESYEKTLRREKREEQEKAFEILDVLCNGNENWKRVRTLGDYDSLRLQIAGVLS